MLLSRRSLALLLAFAILLITGCAVTAGVFSSSVVDTLIANLQSYADATGTVSTDTTAGSIDPSGVFFQSLGTNQRTCATCHQLSQGMSINAATTAALFTSSSGTDPLFTAIDGANCPTATTGNLAQHSLLVQNGLIRIAITLPQTAQFKLSVVSDPYGCALSTSSTTGTQIVSVYRRPLPTTSANFFSSIMWDTRETVDSLTSASTFSANLDSDLTAQALTAISTHEQGSATPTIAQTTALISFLESLYTAQASSTSAGSLSVDGATGGATALAGQNFYPGINDAFGQDPTGARFNPNVFSLYTAWSNSTTAAQASIARGEQIFNNSPLNITNVPGINDNAALGSPAVVKGSCSTCHDTPNVGNHSLPLVMDTGASHLVADESDPNIAAALAQISQPSLPVYEVSGCTGADGNAVTLFTSDPGKGLISGLCADVNRIKLPSLRGLAARAPYFHNGSATSLVQVVSFYNARFQMHLNAQQQTDLVNFLNAL
jgi:hypothetical protein